ncbi:MAG: hypothetical protein GY803_15795 [Chloroflexi bacterium]|nr:hypothetical protein [Chloroflexota bacterium]
MDWLKKAEETLFPKSEEQNDLQKAILEWDFTGDVKDYGRPCKQCEICGNDGLRYHFEIRNAKTGGRMSVGSSCITRFDIAVYDENGQAIPQKEKQTFLKKKIDERARENILETLRRLWRAEAPLRRQMIESYAANFKKYHRFSPKEILFLFKAMEANQISFNPRSFKVALSSFENRLEYTNLSPDEQRVVQQAMSQAEIDSFYAR